MTVFKSVCVVRYRTFYNKNLSLILSIPIVYQYSKSRSEKSPSGKMTFINHTRRQLIAVHSRKPKLNAGNYES